MISKSMNKTILTGSFIVAIAAMMFGSVMPAIAEPTIEVDKAKCDPDDKKCIDKPRKKIAKVALCHVTGSEENPVVIILVSPAAVPAHIAHGDSFASELKSGQFVCPRELPPTK